MSQGDTRAPAPGTPAKRPTRRHTREWALQLLFQFDMNPSEVEPALARFWEDKGADGKAIEFTESLVKGVLANQKSIDADIRSYAENWELGRMAVVDRNVLRMAIYEMKFCPDIPPVVSINEAVDIVKYYSSTESGRFVNGILDRIRKDVDRPARKAVRKTSS